VYHSSAWIETVRQAYGYKPCGLLAHRRDDGCVVGALPLMLVDSFLTGKRLVSLPFTAYCDPLGAAWNWEHVQGFLARRYPGVQAVRFRFLYDQTSVGEAAPARYVTHILDLAPGADEIFRAAHNTSIRQRIRRARRNGFEVRWEDSDAALGSFYRLLIRVRKRLGLPPPPYGFFRSLWECLRPEKMVELPAVLWNGKTVAAGIVLKFGDRVHLEYSASDERFMKEGVNPLLIWEAVRMACRQGARFFDFGRSSVANRSLIEFKERWGATAYPLRYVGYPRSTSQDLGPARQ